MTRTKYKRLLALVLAIMLGIPNGFVFADISSPGPYELYPDLPNAITPTGSEFAGLGIFPSDAQDFDYTNASEMLSLDPGGFYDFSTISGGAYKVVLYPSGDAYFPSPPTDVNVGPSSIDINRIELVAPLGQVTIYDTKNNQVIGDINYEIKNLQDQVVFKSVIHNGVFYVPPIPTGQYNISLMPKGSYLGGNFQLDVNGASFNFNPSPIKVDLPSFSFKFEDEGNITIDPSTLTFINDSSITVNSIIQGDYYNIYGFDQSPSVYSFHAKGGVDNNGFDIYSKVIEPENTQGGPLINGGPYNGNPITIPMRGSNNIFELQDANNQPLTGAVYEVVFLDNQNHPVYIVRTNSNARFGLYLDPTMNFTVNVEEVNNPTNKVTGLNFSYDGTPRNNHVIMVDFGNQGPPPSNQNYVQGDIKLQYGTNWQSLTSGATVYLMDSQQSVLRTQVITNGSFRFDGIADGSYLVRAQLTEQTYLDYGFNNYLTNNLTVSGGVANVQNMTFNFFDNVQQPQGVIRFNIFDNNSSPLNMYKFFMKETTTGNFSSQSTRVENTETFTTITDGAYKIYFASTKDDVLGKSNDYQFKVIGGKSYLIDGITEITTPVDINILQGKLISPVYMPNGTLADDRTVVEIMDSSKTVVIKMPVKIDGKVFAPILPQGSYFAKAVYTKDDINASPSPDMPFTVDQSGNISGISRIDLQYPQITFDIYKDVGGTNYTVSGSAVVIDILDNLDQNVHTIYTDRGTASDANIPDGQYKVHATPMDTALQATHDVSDWKTFTVSGGVASVSMMNLVLKEKGVAPFEFKVKTAPDMEYSNYDFRWWEENKTGSLTLVKNGSYLQITDAVDGNYMLRIIPKDNNNLVHDHPLKFSVMMGKVYLEGSQTPIPYQDIILEQGTLLATMQRPVDITGDYTWDKYAVEVRDDSRKFLEEYYPKPNGEVYYKTLSGAAAYVNGVYKGTEPLVGPIDVPISTDQQGHIIGNPPVINYKYSQANLYVDLIDAQGHINEGFDVELLDADGKFIYRAHGMNGKAMLTDLIDGKDYKLVAYPNESLLAQGYYKSNTFSFTFNASTAPFETTLVLQKLTVQLEAQAKYMDQNQMTILDKGGSVEIYKDDMTYVGEFFIANGKAKIGNLQDGHYLAMARVFKDSSIYDRFRKSDFISFDVTSGVPSTSLVDLTLKPYVENLTYNIFNQSSPYTGEMRIDIRPEDKQKDIKVNFEQIGNTITIIDAANGTYRFKAYAVGADTLSYTPESVFTVSGGVATINNTPVTAPINLQLLQGKRLLTVNIPNNVSEASNVSLFMHQIDSEVEYSLNGKTNGEVFFSNVPTGNYEVYARYFGKLGPWVSVQPLMITIDQNGDPVPTNAVLNMFTPNITASIVLTDDVFNTHQDKGIVVIRNTQTDAKFDVKNMNGEFLIGGLSDGTYELQGFPDDYLASQGYVRSQVVMLTVSGGVPSMSNIILTLEKANPIMVFEVSDDINMPLYDFFIDLMPKFEEMFVKPANTVQPPTYNPSVEPTIDILTIGNKGYLLKVPDGEYNVVVKANKSDTLSHSKPFGIKIVGGMAYTPTMDPITGIVSVSVKPKQFEVRVLNTAGTENDYSNVIMRKQSGEIVYVDEVKKGEYVKFGPQMAGAYYIIAMDSSGANAMPSKELYVTYDSNGAANQGGVLDLRLTQAKYFGNVVVIDDSNQETTNTDGIKIKLIKNDTSILYKVPVLNGNYAFGDLSDGTYKIVVDIPQNMIDMGYLKPVNMFFTVETGNITNPIPKIIIAKEGYQAGDKTALQALVTKIEGFNTSGMVQSKIAQLSSMLTEANTLLGQTSPMQTDLDNKLQELNWAVSPGGLLDIIEPQYLLSNTNLTNQPITVTLTGPAVSVYEVKVRVNNGTEFTYTEPIQVDNNGTVSYYAKYDIIMSDMVNVNIDNIDREPPVIYINGPKDVYLNVNDNYEEYGVNVFDKDTSITPIIDSSAVNTSVPGVYDVVYKATDAAGNYSERIRKVYVKDSIAPNITVTSNSKPIDNIEVIGSDIIVNVVVTDDTDQNPTVEVRSNGILVNGSGTYQVPLLDGYNVISVVSEDTNHNKSFKAFNVINKILPIKISNFSLTNQNVFIQIDNTMISSSLLDSLTVEYSTDGTNWNTFDKVNGLEVSQNGNYKFRAKINNVTTFSKNFEFGIFNIDKTAPADPQIVVTNTQPTKENVLVLINSNEKAEIRIDGGKWTEVFGYLVMDKNGLIEARSVDKAGNYSNIVSATVTNIDTTAPTITNKSLSINDAAVDPSVVNKVKLGDVIKVDFTVSEGNGFVRFNEEMPVKLVGNGNQFSYVVQYANNISRPENKIVIWSEDSAGNMSEKVLLTSKLYIDVIKPEIKLFGSDVTLEVSGQNIQLPGYTGFDDLDGDITDKVVVGGNVNYGAVGNYVLTYDVNDSAGNSATQKTRNISIVDTRPPEIVTTLNNMITSSSTLDFDVTINDNYSTNIVPNVMLNNQSVIGTSGKYSVNLAEGVNNITITATDSSNNSAQRSFTVEYKKPVSDRPVIIPSITSPTNMDVVVGIVGPSGSEIQYSTDGSIWLAYTEPIKFTQNGRLFARSRSNASSLWSSVVVYEVTNIDKVPPAKPQIILSNNLRTTSDITATIVSEGKTTVLINGKLYEYTGPITITENVTITVISEDEAGNTNTTTKNIVNIDREAPIGTVVLSTTEPTFRNVFATLIVNEDFAMVSGERYHIFEENGSYTFQFKDLAGNIGSATATVTNIDKTAPTISSIAYTVNQENKTYAKGGDVINITFETSEPVTGKLYAENRGYPFESYVSGDKNLVSVSMLASTDYTGYMNVFGRILDTAGNSIITGIVNTLKIDNTKPAIDVGFNNGTKRGLNGYVTDDILMIKVLSDAPNIYYGDSEISVTTKLDSNIFTVPGSLNDGEEHTYYFKSIDDAGNESVIKHLTFKWDNTKPAAPTIDTVAALTNEKLMTFTGNSEAGNIRVEKIYNNVPIKMGEYSYYKLAEGISLNLFEGSNTFKFRTVDFAGNVSDPTTVTTTLDRKEPLVKITKNDGTGNYDITSNEAITVLGYSINGGTFVSSSSTTILSTVFGSGDNLLTVEAQDAAGNKGYGRLTIVNIVANEPIVNKPLSDGVTLLSGAFTGNTELHMNSLTEAGGNEIIPDGNNEFISEPLDFTTTGDVGFVEPILIDLDLGLGHPQNTKLYYYDDNNVWHSLDRSTTDGDSYYNYNSTSVTKYNVNGMFEDSGAAGQAITVLPGHLVALLRHFSEYAAQADTSAPVITVTSPGDQDKLKGGSVTIVGSVNELSTVSIYNNSSKVTDIASVNGSFQYNLSLAEGTNLIEVKAVDASSNQSTANPKFTVYHDSIKPSVSHNLTNTSTKDEVFTITATITETNSVTTNIYLNGSAVNTSTSKDLSYLVNLKEGSNTIQIIVVDEYGNQYDSGTYTRTLDATGPTVTITGVSDNDVATDDVTVGVTLSESGSWVATYNDGTTSKSVNTNQSFTITATEGQSTNYTLTIDASDSLGNSTTKSISFVINKSAPTITFTGQPSSNVVNTDVTIGVSVTPTTSVVTSKLYKDDVRQDDINGSTTLTDEASYKISVEAINNGTLGKKSVEFTIDKTKPTISITGVESGKTYTSNVSVSYSISDTNGIASQTATIKKDQGTAENLSSGAVISTNGTYEVTVTAVDNGGNSETKSLSFTMNIPTSTGGSSSSSDKGSSTSSGGVYYGTDETVSTLPPKETTVADFIEVPKDLEDIKFAITDKSIVIPKDFKITVEKADKVVKTKVVGSLIGTGSKVLGDVVVIKSNNSKAKVPLEVKLPVVKDQITNVEKVTIRVLDEATGKWKILPGKVDLSNGVATTNTSTYGTFALIEGNKTFKDLDTASWSQNAVEVMASREVINGYDSESFKPNADISRAEFATIIVKALALEKGQKSVDFSDTKGLWYEEAIDIAASNGIMSGFDGKASPDQKITREQMAVMIINAFKLSGQLPDNQTDMVFDDKDQMSSWAVEQINSAASLGIITGKGDGGFYPTDVATRAEATTMIYRLLKALGII